MRISSIKYPSSFQQLIKPTYIKLKNKLEPWGNYIKQQWIFLFNPINKENSLWDAATHLISTYLK